MTYTIQPRRVCSRAMMVEVDDQDVIQALQVAGGCSGNLQGLAALLRGMKVQEAITRLKGIDCGGRGTSCPDQLALGLEQILKHRAEQ